MALSIVYGKKGSGKSYYCMARALEWLASGADHWLVTNIEMDLLGVSRYYERFRPDIESPAELAKRVWVIGREEAKSFFRYRAPHLPKVEDGVDGLPTFTAEHATVKVMYVIDEVHLLFNARAYQKTGAQPIAAVSQSSKLQDVWMFTLQSPAGVDKMFRDEQQVDEWVKVWNLGKVPVMGMFRGFKGVLLYRKTDVLPTLMRRGSLQGVEWMRVNPRGVGGVYRTGDGIGVKGTRGADGKVEAAKGVSLAWLGLVPLLLGGGCYYAKTKAVGMVGKALTAPVAVVTNEVKRDTRGIGEAVKAVALAAKPLSTFGGSVKAAEWEGGEQAVEVVATGYCRIGKRETVYLSDGRAVTSEDSAWGGRVPGGFAIDGRFVPGVGVEVRGGGGARRGPLRGALPSPLP